MKKKINQIMRGRYYIRFLNISFLIVAFFFSQFVAIAQQRTITGTVTGTDNSPLPGVTITVPGTTLGTITDMQGRFSLPIPTTVKTLVFSFVGMETQELTLDSRNDYTIKLSQSVVGLEEVVVVGYGSQKKQSIVGSISQTTNEKLQQTGNVTNLAQALTGQLPGVITLMSTAEPGGSGALSTSGGVQSAGNTGTNVFIRGRNTWNGGQPLILVDGIERDMYNIDVGEVENISILKDASATAVFGVKGANGVILITTKRGSSGKPKITLNYSTTGQFVSKLPEKASSFESQQARNEAILREVPLREASWSEYLPFEISRRYLPENQKENPDWWWIYPDVDWQDAMFKDMGVSHRATLNVNGGTDFVKYFGSVSYLNEGDMLEKWEPVEEDYKPSYGFNRFNFRSNLDFSLTKTTKLQVNLSGYLSKKDVNMAWTQYNIGTQGQMWSAVYRMPPDIYLPRYPDGRWGSYPLISHGTLDNPVAFAQNMGVNTYRGTQLNSDFALEQKLDFITEGLSAKVQFYYDNVIYSRNYIYDYSNGMIIKSGQALNKYVDIWAYTGDPNQPESEYIFNYPINPAGTSQFDWVNPIPSLSNETVLDNITTRRMQYQFQLNYAHKFGLHNVGALAAMKRQEYAQGSMFKNYREDWVFRATYDYDTKYLIEMNGAYNGSEQFGPGYRFDFFPSLALGYLISNEKFFPLDWMNRLKLRYSVGMVGDDNVSGRWLYTDAYAYGGAARMNTQDHDLSPYTQYNQSSIGNPDIHWEKALKNNYGIEMGILNDMIMVNYDYFTEDRTDILLAGSARSVPSHFGGSVPPANLGQVKANGHELEVKFDKRRGMGLHYWAAVAITHTNNEIIFKDDPELLWDYRKAAGHTINQRFIQIRADRYNTWDDIYASVPAETNDLGKMPGFWNMIDFNADGIIKSDDSAPYQFSDIPENTFNYSMGADYKGFSAMIQFYGVTNVTRYQSLSNFSNRLNVWFVHMRDYWSKDNLDGDSYMPKWRSSGAQLGDYWLVDGSYWRIKTAEIAYTLPQSAVQKLGLGNLRLYLNGNNLYFWSRMLDDREGSFLGGGDSEGAYPSVKRVNLGIEVTF